MSSAGTSEREVKWDIDPDFVLPDFRDLVGQTTKLGEQELQAAYFDTSDLRLWSRRISLRHRQGEGPPPGTWILELPVSTSGDVPERSELTWPGPRDAVPGEARRIIRGIVRHEWLAPIVEIESRRRRIALLGDDGSPLGELDDDWVTVHGGSRDGLRFRQIEFELEDAGAGLLEGVTGRLRSAGADPSAPGPNLQRALDDELGRDSLPSLDGRSTVGDLIRQSLPRGLQRIGHHDYRLRLRHRDPATVDIHECQVAVRRLRSELNPLGPALDPVWLRHLRTDLQWVGSALGPYATWTSSTTTSIEAGQRDWVIPRASPSWRRRSGGPDSPPWRRWTRCCRVTAISPSWTSCTPRRLLRPSSGTTRRPVSRRPGQGADPGDGLPTLATAPQGGGASQKIALRPSAPPGPRPGEAGALRRRAGRAGHRKGGAPVGGGRQGAPQDPRRPPGRGGGRTVASRPAGHWTTHGRLCRRATDADLAVRRHRARRHWRKAWKQTNRSPVGLWVP